MSKNTVNRQSGFTLIELLIVITIIASLAAILVPSYAKSRQMARVSAATQVASSCLANAFAVYSAANEGALPDESVIGSQQGLVQFAQENDCDLPEDNVVVPGRPRQEVRIDYWDFRCYRFDPIQRRIIVYPCRAPWASPQPTDYQLFLSVRGVDPELRGSMLVLSGANGVAQVTKAEAMDLFNLR